MRRWEVWAVNTENGEVVEDRIARCFTRWGARLRRFHAEMDRLTPRVLRLWNERWPDRQLGLRPRYEVRRAR